MTTSTSFSLRRLPGGRAPGSAGGPMGPILFHVNIDRRSHLAPIASVNTVGELERQNVLARSQLHFRTGLRLSEMQMRGVLRDHCSCGNTVARIDEEMVVTRTRHDRTRRV